MSSATPAPVPYRVVYTERVRDQLLLLADAARERGDGAAFVTSLREFDRRLRLYPQFGDPLTDLRHETGQTWIGIIRPLAIRYTVFDERRIVFVAAIPVLLPKERP